MQSSRTWVAATIGLLMLGCSPWPPDKQMLVDHFRESRQSIESLKTLLDESEFDQVLLKGKNHVWGLQYEDEIRGDEPVREGAPENTERWIDLFGKASVDSIFRSDDGGVSLPVLYYISHPGMGFHANYVNGSRTPLRLQECRREFADIDCGFCMVTLDNDWWLTFGWWPSDLSDREFAAWQDGEITEDKYYELQEQKYDQCVAGGSTLIGDSQGK